MHVGPLFFHSIYRLHHRLRFVHCTQGVTNQGMIPMRYFIFVLCLGMFRPASVDASVQARNDSTRTHGLYFYPILYYTPETSLAFGGSMQYTTRFPSESSHTRPSSIIPVFIYTLKNQIIARLPLDFYWRNEAYHLFTGIQYKDYPDVFYGIGNDTEESDKEDFTTREFSVASNFKWRFVEGWYAGVQLEFVRSRLTETEEDGQLDVGRFLGTETGQAAGLGVLLEWDSRNNIFFPTSGRFHHLSAVRFVPFFGSDYDFSRYTIDLREYIPLSRGHVLALQAFTQIITGQPPFYMMSMLGGPNKMRGYFYGRYRDRNMCAFQAEYRFPVWGPFGGGVFAGMGDVSRDIGDLFSKSLKPTYGFGLRFLLDPKERINLRVDFGFGKGTSGIYLGAVEVF